MKSPVYEANFAGIFKDNRLNKRGNLISSLVNRSQKCPIKSMTSNEAEQKGFYRFLKETKVQ